jgi:hypothetical protein
MASPLGHRLRRCHLRAAALRQPPANIWQASGSTGSTGGLGETALPKTGFRVTSDTSTKKVLPKSLKLRQNTL